MGESWPEYYGNFSPNRMCVQNISLSGQKLQICSVKLINLMDLDFMTHRHASTSFVAFGIERVGFLTEYTLFESKVTVQ